MEPNLPDERIVAFLDILGFRDLVRRMEGEAGLYDLVAGVTEALNKNIGGVLHGPLANVPSSSRTGWLPVGGIVHSHFSDSMILSGPIDQAPEGTATTLRTICSFCSLIATRLLRHGILVRGGIAKGWMRHAENLALGAGLVEAYSLESQVAKWPRILVADSLAGLLADEPHMLRRDVDLAWFLNPVASLAGEVKLGIRVDSTFSDIPSALELELSRNHSPEVQAKLRWMARQFNEEVTWAFDIAGREVDWVRRVALEHLLG